MGEVVPPIPAAEILTVENIAGYKQNREPWLKAILASHEALRAERDAHWQVVLHTREAARKCITEANELRAELVVVRQALTDLLARYDPVHRARAVLAGDQCAECCYSGGWHAEDCSQP